MTPYERMKAMTQGKDVDRPGASVWKHFHLEDRNVTDLVKKTISFQEQNDWDLIKVMANGVYLQDQYGAEIAWSEDGITFPATLRRVVNSPRGFRHLKTTDVTTGPVHREVEVVKRLMDRYGGKVPVLATVFTPLTYAQELYNGWQNPYAFKDLLDYYGDDLLEGLKVLTEVTAAIIEEYTKTGVDGIFYSTQFASDLQITGEQYDVFGKPFDLQAFEPALGRTWFNMLHLHGDTNLYFEKFLDYPFEILNWQSTITNVSLADAAKMTDKILAGGIEREHDFRYQDRQELYRHLRTLVEDAAASVPANRLLITPGCAIPNDIPEFRLNVLKDVLDDVYA